MRREEGVGGDGVKRNTEQQCHMLLTTSSTDCVPRCSCIGSCPCNNILKLTSLVYST